MVTHEEYLKAKRIVEEYEEYHQGMADCFYCTSCDAMNEQECICDYAEECSLCGGENGEHHLSCPDNDSPYANLLRNGYD